MPFPYRTISIPPGDWKDPFESPAITMAILHNMFIRGMNAIYAQAASIREEQTKPFAFFCMQFFEMVHHHHHVEETYSFPIYETKFGKGTMEGNVEQHRAFMNGLLNLENYMKDVYAGGAQYSGTSVLEKLDSFAEVFVLHLNEEIPTLEASRLRAAFTRKEKEEMEAEEQKIALKGISLTETMPLPLVCHDRSTADHFPPLPKPLLWAVQYGFSWKHNAAWEFGPCDIYGKLKPGLGND